MAVLRKLLQLILFLVVLQLGRPQTTISQELRRLTPRVQALEKKLKNSTLAIMDILVTIKEDLATLRVTTQQQEQCNATLEEARAEITMQQQILDTIRGDAQYPATSCKQIAELRPGLPSGYYWITTTSDNAVQVYCDMTRECCSSSGGWTRVAYLNMSDPTHSCPPGWRTIESRKRTCGRTSGPGYETVTYSTHGVEYSHVCGQIRGYQESSPDAFWPFTNDPSLTIDDIYVDGVSVTYGTSPRQHIWTFAAAAGDSYTTSPVCRCTHPPETDSLAVPPFVGNDYFCEAGTDTWKYTFYSDDPLWDGQDCPSPSTCCQFNSPPWFCKTLAEPTTGDIEVRLMANEVITNEDIPIELIEIYIQ